MTGNAPIKPLIPYFDATHLRIFEGFTLNTPGLLLVLGLALGTYVAMQKARRDGLEPELVFRMLIWIVVGVFVGGHLGHLLLYYPEVLLNDPMSIFEVWGGLSSFGGFIACAGLFIWFFRREIRKRRADGSNRLPPINIWAYADTIIYGVILGWSFGRLGCFSVHDHPGIETEFWLGVYGICPSGAMNIACHDLGFYEAVWSLLFFALFTLLDRTPHFPGFFVGVLTVCYGPTRFLLDMLRHPAVDARYFGFTPAQYGSVVLFLIGVWILITRRNIPAARPETTHCASRGRRSQPNVGHQRRTVKRKNRSLGVSSKL